MEINPKEIDSRDMYKLLTGAVQPRPIAWVSSLSANGVPNLAPFSFFNAVCSDPPTVLFCPGVRRMTGLPKDTWRNVEATGEFVINIVSENLAEAMNITATELDPDVNEFHLAGLTAAPSVMVKPPRVLESPISMECKLNQIITISDQPGGGAIVIGTVVYMRVAEEVYIPDYKIDPTKLLPLGRLGGPQYSRMRDIFSLERPAPQISKK